eukprot:COSAG06_NODE_2505_length_6750_cov_3.393926_9_plen_76_part_00
MVAGSTTRALRSRVGPWEGTTGGRLPTGSVANVRLNRRSRLSIFKNPTLTYLNTALNNGWLLARARKAAVQLTPH